MCQTTTVHHGHAFSSYGPRQSLDLATSENHVAITGQSSSNTLPSSNKHVSEKQPGIRAATCFHFTACLSLNHGTVGASVARSRYPSFPKATLLTCPCTSATQHDCAISQFKVGWAQSATQGAAQSAQVASEAGETEAFHQQSTSSSNTETCGAKTTSKGARAWSLDPTSHKTQARRPICPRRSTGSSCRATTDDFAPEL